MIVRFTVPGKPVAKGRPRKASDEQIILSYESLGSCAHAAKALGMCAQSVHERLVKLGANKPQRQFTADDTARLARDYNDYVSRGDLEKLADEMGRTRNFICRKARAIGLTDIKRTNKVTFEAASAAAKKRIVDYGHPRGMVGKTHSIATKVKISEASTGMWQSMTEDERSQRVVAMMRGKVDAGIPLAGTHTRGSWKAGWREIGGKRNYYRSRWEANYAHYLEWLKAQGEIVDWQHEPETFWFDGIKRGVRSYLPDFRVWETDGTSRLHEVKGWMDARSKTTIKRMAKYHPQEVLIVIRERDYNAIARKVSGMIDGWEHAERKGRL